MLTDTTTAATAAPTPQREEVTILLMLARDDRPDRPEITALWSLIPIRNRRARQRAIARDAKAHLIVVQSERPTINYTGLTVVGVMRGHCQPAEAV